MNNEGYWLPSIWRVLNPNNVENAKSCNPYSGVKPQRHFALPGGAPWIECQTENRRAAGSIPTQGTRLGCRQGSRLGAHKRQPHVDISLPLSLPLSLKINK